LTDVVQHVYKKPKIRISNEIGHPTLICGDMPCYWIGSNDSEFQKLVFLSHNLSRSFDPSSCPYKYVRASSDKNIMSDDIVDVTEV
jgi:hypothetical protein